MSDETESDVNGYLIKKIIDSNDANDLGDANKFLAKKVKEHVQSICSEANNSLKTEWHIVADLTKKLDLRDTDRPQLINVDEQNFVELLNQIRHIEICYQVYKYLLINEGVDDFVHIHSTQSNGKNKHSEADIEFKNAAIEVFGGSDLTSNNKFKKDVSSLCEINNKNKRSQEKFVAFYENCLTGNNKQQFAYKKYFDGNHNHRNKNDDSNGLFIRTFDLGDYKYSFSPQILKTNIDSSRLSSNILLVKLHNLTRKKKIKEGEKA